MDLQDFLILPIQRLPRYSMLLKVCGEGDKSEKRDRREGGRKEGG